MWDEDIQLTTNYSGQGPLSVVWEHRGRVLNCSTESSDDIKCTITRQKTSTYEYEVRHPLKLTVVLAMLDTFSLRVNYAILIKHHEFVQLGIACILCVAMCKTGFHPYQHLPWFSAARVSIYFSDTDSARTTGDGLVQRNIHCQCLQSIRIQPDKAVCGNHL